VPDRGERVVAGHDGDQRHGDERGEGERAGQSAGHRELAGAGAQQVEHLLGSALVCGHGQVWVLGLDPGQQRRIHERRDGAQERHGQPAVDRALPLAAAVLEHLGLVQQHPGFGEQDAAARGETHALGAVPAEQLRAQLTLEALDGHGHRGLRRVQGPRGVRHVAHLGGRDEVAELSQAEVGDVGHGGRR
jgi:hypothetical protein